MRKLIRTYPVGFAIALLFFVVFFGNRVATLYTDWLWFGEVGQRGVFARIYGARIFLFSVFGAASFFLAYFNLHLANRFAPNSRAAAPAGTVYLVAGAEPVGRAVRFFSGFRPFLNALLLGGALFFASGAGLSAQLEWDGFLRFTKPERFGVLDPLFGRDIGYYVFTLPFLRYVQGWVFTVLMLLGGGITLLYVYQRSVNSVSGLTLDAPHVRAHLSAIVGLAFLAKAWGYYLDRFDLMYRGGFLFNGAGYADIHSRLPMLHLLMAVSILAALTVFINIWRRTIILPAAAIALWLAFSGAGVVIPGAMQRLRVRPNEAAREAPYIKQAIQATRAAYDIADVELKNFPATETGLDAEMLARNAATVENIRLWDHQPLLETYPQQQALRQYYAFPDVDVDRYTLGGKEGKNYELVMIALRELNPQRLDDRAQTWPNLHLRYTHGYGAVVSAAGRVTGEGLPDYLLKDIPPTPAPGAERLALSQPRIYYGAGSPGDAYVVVGTKQREFDFPEDGKNGSSEKETSYSGKGGVRLIPLARWAFAARFSDGASLLLNADITRDAKLLFWRRVSDRVKRVAPFLQMDSDPYPVIADGRIVWVLDAYTTSGAYPYSAFSDGGDGLSRAIRFNYIRNAVKATVDAYDGTIVLYAADKTCPILRSYRRIFPRLIRDADEMPAAIRAHRRYPRDLFAIQRRILADYHVTDAGVFYSRADGWEMPRSPSTVEGTTSYLDTDSEAMDPYYMLLRLPDAQAEEFVLMSPFTPRRRENMIALFTARNDGDNYGKRTLYRFPSSRTLFGPQQVGRRIRSDRKISPYISLVDQRGSRVLFGSMLVVPIETSLLYVQPLYVKAQLHNRDDSGKNDTAAVTASAGSNSSSDPALSLPELKQVVVAYENRIAMQPTLPAALAELFGAAKQAAPAAKTATPAQGAGKAMTASAAALIEQASQQYDRAQKTLRAGDFTAYGKEIKALGDTLRRLRVQTGQGKEE